MRQIKNIIKGGEGASPLENRLHQAYLTLFLTAFGVANGLLALRLAACSYAAFWHPWVWASYFERPPIVLLNILPGLLFIWLGYFLFRRAWAAYLFSAVPCIGLALVNYYKIQLRGDPLLASDLWLIRTARGILGRYSLDITRVVLVAVGCAGLMLLFSVFLMPNGLRSRRIRLGGVVVCLALMPLLYSQVYMSPPIYRQTAGEEDMYNRWSNVESFVSRGFWYPFVCTLSGLFPSPPEGYYAGEARALLASYEDADIPEDKRVSVVGVMLEAFADFTDFPMLAEREKVAALYEPLHELEARSVSGDLLTNIFAGGTVDSEWGFLTGYSTHEEFRAAVDTYVRYFSAQGYETAYRHPGYGWMYNRANVNEYLGFSDSVFTENGFGDLVDPEEAPKRSDAVLFGCLLGELEARSAEDAPLFLFSVSYQNHGPYDDRDNPGGVLTEAETGWSLPTVSIVNNYLSGVADTIAELARFTGGLEALDEPVVLVVYGDHKPWLGNDNSAYLEMGVDLDVTEPEGFYNYYATPYLIWANGAAKAVLGGEFTGDGGDFSPCFLMPELFDLCGWEGPGFLRLSRELRSVTPLVHERGIYLEDGVLADALSPDAAAFYRRFLWAQYYRETHAP